MAVQKALIAFRLEFNFRTRCVIWNKIIEYYGIEDFMVGNENVYRDILMKLHTNDDEIVRLKAEYRKRDHILPTIQYQEGHALIYRSSYITRPLHITVLDMNKNIEHVLTIMQEYLSIIDKIKRCKGTHLKAFYFDRKSAIHIPYYCDDVSVVYHDIKTRILQCSYVNFKSYVNYIAVISKMDWQEFNKIKRKYFCYNN